MAHSCRILAIDGGGIRGIIPAYVLQQVEAQLGKPIHQLFDVIAGTSTGGIITLALTTPRTSHDPPYAPPYSAAEVLDFYLNDEANLFVKQSSGDGAEAKYYGTKPGTPPIGIQPWLQAHFPPKLTLSQAASILQAGGQGPRQVLVTCYTIAGAPGVSYAPYLFNWVDAANPADDYLVWEAARATSAAPTYFPVAQIGAGAPGGSSATMRWAVDGGLMANDPGLFALAEAQRLGLFDSLSEVVLVSLGTGLYNAGVEVSDGEGNWGAVQWTAGVDNNGNLTEPLLSTLAMANQQVPDQQLACLLASGTYLRLEPSLPYSESTMDGTDTQTLLTTAKGYIAPGGAGYSKFQSVLAALG